MYETWKSAEINRMLFLRAIEWVVWPAFLSPLYVPILLTLCPWWKTFLTLFAADLIWCLFRDRIHNIALANFAAIAVKWVGLPTCIICSIVLICQKRYGTAVLSFLMPFISGFLGIPGNIGLAKLNFGREIGFGLADEDLNTLSN